jgi:hypothetical protein
MVYKAVFEFLQISEKKTRTNERRYNIQTHTHIYTCKTDPDGSDNVLKNTTECAGSRQWQLRVMLKGMKHDAGAVILKETGLKVGGTVHTI